MCPILTRTVRFEVALFQSPAKRIDVISNKRHRHKTSLSLEGESSLSEERVPSPAATASDPERKREGEVGLRNFKTYASG